MTEVKRLALERLERFVLAVVVDQNMAASPLVDGTVAAVDRYGAACPVDAPVTAAGRFEEASPVGAMVVAAEQTAVGARKQPVDREATSAEGWKPD